MTSGDVTATSFADPTERSRESSFLSAHAAALTPAHHQVHPFGCPRAPPLPRGAESLGVLRVMAHSCESHDADRQIDDLLTMVLRDDRISVEGSAEKDGAATSPWPTEASSSHEPSVSTGGSSRCWGHIIKALGGKHDDSCEPGFVLGKQHFKTKFCAACRQGLAVPADHVRILTPALEAAFCSNEHKVGLWSRFDRDGLCVEFRLANQTLTCCGPKMVIFKAPPPAELFTCDWAPMPPEWLEDVTNGWCACYQLAPALPQSRACTSFQMGVVRNRNACAHVRAW